MPFMLRLLANAAALWVAARLVPGVAYEGGWLPFLGVAFVFSVINSTLRPVAKILTFPLIIATLGALGFAFDAIVDAARELQPVSGRMGRLGGAGQPLVVIDYAHTPDALEQALATLRAHCEGRLICVFGCGGERDAGKRPLMGKVAGELADVPIATSDNPRGEDPLAILAAVEEGLARSGNRAARTVPDRRQAIREAVALAAPGDVVLVAGKGHEEVQVVGGARLPFSDRLELARALEERFGPRHPG